jgi:RNA polymerase sigma factor (sigma-70 family)
MSDNSIPRRRPPTLRELQRVAESAKASTPAEAFPGGSLRQFLSDQVGGRLRAHLAAWVEEYHQAFRQALAALCKVQVVTLEEIFPPGTFCGDVLLLLDKEKTDEERYQAARRLATVHLTWRSVYGSAPGLQQRWEQVRPAFESYCREHELSYGQGWEQLVTQIICDLVLRLPDDVTLNELRWYLTLELRKELERELLGGTADQLTPIDSAERIVMAEDVPDGLEDVRLDVWLALQRLDPLDRELLVDVFLHERSYSELAAQYGVSEKTIRRRIANSLQWLRADRPS